MMSQTAVFSRGERAATDRPRPGLGRGAAPARRIVSVFGALLAMLAAGAPDRALADGPQAGPIARPGPPMRLRYDKPAADNNDGWVSQSLPLGNGYMGVNVFGGVERERLQVTENSLIDSPTGSIGGLNNFAEVRIDFAHTAPRDYTRELDLNTGTARVAYVNDGVRYTRDYFASYPDKVFAVRLQASKRGALDFTIHAAVPYTADFRQTPGDHHGKHGTVSVDKGVLTLSGTMDYYGLKFEGQIKVIPDGGTVQAVKEGGGSIKVSGATSALIVIAVGTNYPIAEPQVFSAPDRLDKLKGFADPHAKVTGYVTAAASRTYADLLARHEADYGALYGRVALDFGAAVPAATTDRLIDAARAGAADPYLDALAFQFGRYLLISSSRKGALPPNLQGVWNVYQDAPWTAGYWHNINLQMNYWPAFNTNLPDLFEPYVDLYRSYLPAQRALATRVIGQYHPDKLAADGDNGWTMGTAMRPFEPGGRSPHSGFGTGAWTASMFWDAYDFTRDTKMLRDTVYPALRGQANFLSRMLEDVDGKLLAKPSSSPENANNLQTVGTTFDQQEIYENDRDTIAAARVLGLNDPLLAVLKREMPRLDPIVIGDSGQIKEYREETIYGSIGEPQHRHASQLLGLYPGQLITAQTPAWLDAARVSLKGRGLVSKTGWAQAELLATWARTGDGDMAYDFYRYWLSHHAMYNLWNNHRDSFSTKLLQIDGNFGVTAGVGEMLLQSQSGVVAPLAALPRAWPKGRYRGLLARGAFEVSADWSDGHADRLALLSRAGGPVRLRYPAIAKAQVRTADGGTVRFRPAGSDEIAFDTVQGQSYVVTAIPVEEAVGAVKDLAIASDTGATVRLTWHPTPGAVSYVIDRAVGNAPGYERIGADVKVAQFVDAAALVATTKRVRYRVTALSADGRAGPGAAVFRFEPGSGQVAPVGPGS